MTRRITLPVAALALSGCGLLGPPPTGHIEGRVSVCLTGSSQVEPVCVPLSMDVGITLDGGGGAETQTLNSTTFWFTDVEVGSYMLYAAYTGDTSCLIVFEQKPVTVSEDQIANVVIDGRGKC